jgi:membrane-anchored glycerophosphoryl diester phosphodiesterase (GDPDase)
MEIVYFTLVAIVLYLVSDWILQRVEESAGRRFEHRSLIFFALLLTLALVCFSLIRFYTGNS